MAEHVLPMESSSLKYFMRNPGCSVGGSEMFPKVPQLEGQSLLFLFDVYHSSVFSQS